MPVIVDDERCCSAGNCVLVAPDVFQQSPEDGVVILLTDQPPGEAMERVREAKLLCPVGAIKIVES